MTGNLSLDLSLLALAQLAILLIPWLAPHVVYIGHIDPSRYGEQAATVMRARIFLAFPATVALCWFGARWLDTRHDVAIVLYTALICRLVIFAARFSRVANRGLTWIFTLVVGPLAAWAAVLIVGRRLALTDPSWVMWVFGGIAALVVPPALVVMAGRFAGQGSAVD